MQSDVPIILAQDAGSTYLKTEGEVSVIRTVYPEMPQKRFFPPGLRLYATLWVMTELKRL